jgi:hypothetical protein
VEIWPEPSPQEREAILLALNQATNEREQKTLPHVSPWAAAGRMEAVVGRVVKTRGERGRGAGRIADW